MESNNSLHYHVSQRCESDNRITRKRSCPPCFSATVTSSTDFESCEMNKNRGRVEGSIPSLQVLTGDVLRKQVEGERKDIIRKHSEKYDRKRVELELRRKELQRQLQEVEEQMKSVEIDCHEEMLTEIDHFDNEVQPEMLGALTDIGQPDRICPLCEQFFRSTIELPTCCLGRDRCYLHTVQRCCISCLRPGFYDILQCFASSNALGKIEDEILEGGERGRQQILDDLVSLEADAFPPSWMVDNFLGEDLTGVGQESDGDEYEKSVTTMAAAAIRLVPSETGSVTCPVCRKEYCDYDFLYHFSACCRRVCNTNNDIVLCLEIGK
eukprot:jgi/Psemu1/326415/estExt_fgenesh1_pg.C_3800007